MEMPFTNKLAKMWFSVKKNKHLMHILWWYMAISYKKYPLIKGKQGMPLIWNSLDVSPKFWACNSKKHTCKCIFSYFFLQECLDARVCKLHYFVLQRNRNFTAACSPAWMCVEAALHTFIKSCFTGVAIVTGQCWSAWGVIWAELK